MGPEIMGGYEYCADYPMQRFFRDSRRAAVDGGTSEIQRNVFARSLGL
jgi:acyl-CoA dehydrogenase